MIANRTLAGRMRIIPLTLPLLAENLLRYAFSMADTVMLSGLMIRGVRYGDDAVAAVSLVGSFVFFINIFYSMVNNGSAIVITQYNGAGRPQEAGRAVASALTLAVGFGLVMSLLMFLSARPIISIFGLSPVRSGFAGDYLLIFGSFSLGLSLNTAGTAVLRSYGYSKEPMIINLLANLLNIFGNYLFIYGAFGFPQWGVAGVAVSTVASQSLAAAVMFLLITRKKDIGFSFKKFRLANRRSFKEILRIGVPTGAEHLSYNLAVTVMKYFIARMDAGLPPGAQVNLPAFGYAMIASRFITMFSLAASQGTQIVTGFLAGAGQKEKAYRRVLKYFYYTLGLVALLTVVVSLFRQPLLHLFPMENNVFTLSASLILMCMALETGRTFNLVIIAALKASGDVRFPVQVGLFSMWGIGVGGAFLFGVVLKLGVIGIWLGISLDEWTRGLIMYFRWRSRVWQSKRVIEVPPVESETV